MNRHLIAAIALAAWPAALHAQSPAAHVVVKSDRILIGTEFTPRWATLNPSRSLVVPSGQTVTLPNGDYFAIEVAGTLRCARDRDTSVAVVHVQILPGGLFDCGSAADPVTRLVQLTFLDVPLDLVRDPFQWGNGLVNFGRQMRVGIAKTPFVTAEPIHAGAATLTLREEPVGWLAGDALLIPDTGQVRNAPPRRESPVTIVAIAGRVVTLSKPLDFAHAAITDGDGAVVVYPYVANLTRNIVLRSENPGATRGHTADVGHLATWDVRFNEFRGLGRTRGENLRNTSADGSVIGTNQVGKYAHHHHHAQGFGSRSVGNVYHGTLGSKWAEVVHGTHDAVIEGNVCTDFQGGCFATEDGYEVRNVFRRNFGAYVTGVGQADTNLAGGNDNPGGEGSIYWFRGLHQTIDGNIAINGVSGFTFLSERQVGTGTLAPSIAGGPYDWAVPSDTVAPLSAADNVALANTNAGWELWSVPRFPVDRLIAANNASRQVWAGTSQHESALWFRDATLVAAALANDSVCLSSSAGYVGTLEVEGGRLDGCRWGLINGVARHRVVLRDVLFRVAEYAIEWSGGTHGEVEIVNPLFQTLGAPGDRFLHFQTLPTWQPGHPVPRDALDTWSSQRGSNYLITGWQRQPGADYRLLKVSQERTLAALPAADQARLYSCPEAGLSLGECWDRYGLAPGGDVFAASSAVSLPGVFGAVARVGTARPLGMPLAVMTFPNQLAPAVVRDGMVRLLIMRTGEPSLASEAVGVSIDGQPPGSIGRGFAPDQVMAITWAGSSPGTHVVKTWRLSPDGQKIAASERGFCYYVGTPSRACPFGATSQPPSFLSTSSGPLAAALESDGSCSYDQAQYRVRAHPAGRMGQCGLLEPREAGGLVALGGPPAGGPRPAAAHRIQQPGEDLRRHEAIALGRRLGCRDLLR